MTLASAILNQTYTDQVGRSSLRTPNGLQQVIGKTDVLRATACCKSLKCKY